MAAGLAACGGGSDTPVFTGGGTGTIPDSTATVTVTGPSRVVADTIYSYSASLSSGVASAISWMWGDGSANGTGATTDKVWSKAGNFTGTLSATVAGKTLSATQNAVAVGKPIAAGYVHSCALKPDGTVACWGYNGYGQLGNGTTTDSNTATAVIGLTDAVSVVAGDLHSCALKANGTVVCWGNNPNGQIGDGISSYRTTATAVIGVTDAVSVSAGDSHTCALKADKTVVCWGSNYDGQIGDGTSSNNRATATAVIGLTDAVSVSAGSYHTCALKADKTVVCWGSNGAGQIGDGTLGSANNRATATAVVGLTDAVSITGGSSHSCALKADKTVVCWGENRYGQLANGTTAATTTLSTITGLTDAVSIAAGANHNCALKANGTVACWGYNNYGQIGNASSGNAVTSPFTITALTDVKAVTGGYYHTCALKGDGSAACWGYNSNGQLGDGIPGGSANKSVPTAVAGGAVFWK